MGPWTTGISVHGGPAVDGGTGSPEFRRPAAPVFTDAGQGLGEGEWDTGSSVSGSPGRERRCGGRASWRRGGGRGQSVGGGVPVREMRGEELGEG
jgi:hypothetical protein